MRSVRAFVVAATVTGMVSVALPAQASAPTGSVTLLVTTRHGVGAVAQRAVVTRDGGKAGRSVDRIGLSTVTVPAADEAAYLARYAADPQVAHVEVQHARHLASAATDPSYGEQWALPKIGWEDVHGVVTPAGSATVAVLDTGVSSGADVQQVPGWSAFGTDPTVDPNGHGTALASIAAATADDGTGIAGVAYAGVKVMPVQVLGADGTGQDGDIAAGIVHATDAGADVILMGFSNPGFSQALQDAVDYAWSHGVVLVAATGNDGSTNPTYPAGDAKVVGVSATDSSDALASFSNSGADTFLGAPGVGIADGTGSTSGTSASAAVVAGAAALLRANDGATNGVVVGRLARGADPAGTASDTGNGRVNLARAIADTSTDPVVPAGVAAAGGPLVGPYTIAAGPMTISATFDVTHSTITVSSSGNGDPNAKKDYLYTLVPPSGPTLSSPCLRGTATYTFNLLAGYPSGTWTVNGLRFNNTDAGKCDSTFHGDGTASLPVTVSASVEGTVVNDANASATLDVGEGGIAGVTVTRSGSGTTTAVTNGNGVYSFASVPAGSYSVTYAVPTGFVNTGTRPITVIAPSSGTSTGNNFFAQERDASISGTVYDDADGSGTLTAGDVGLSGRTVTLSTGATTTSGTGGAYSFGGLTAGTYTVTATYPSGYANTLNPITVTVTAGQVSTADDTFAQQRNGAISGTVRDDPNGNGLADDGPGFGLAGVTVSDGVTSTVTDAGGAYSFGSLPNGSYAVTFTTPAGYTSTGAASYVVTVSGGVGASGEDFAVRRTTTTSVAQTAGTNPSTYGGSVTFTATVTALSPSPTDGTVTFFDGASALCTTALGAGSTATCTTSALTAGAHSITASYGGSSTSPGYGSSASAVLSHQVGKAVLTVTPISVHKTYGDANPTFGSTITGFVLGQDVTVVHGTPTCSSVATSTSPVGSYAITCDVSGLSADNYSFAAAPGTLTVDRALLLVNGGTVPETYGDSDPTSGIPSSYSGYVAGDTSGTVVVTGTPTCSVASHGTDVGTYPGVVTCLASGLSATNYSFAVGLAGPVVITPATLAVDAVPQLKTYGDPDPAGTYTLSGFVYGQDATAAGVTGVGVCSIASHAEDVGTYAHVYTCTPGNLSSNNYGFAAGADASLEIDARSLVVTADDLGKTYGDPDPPLTFTATGAVPGDTVTTTVTRTPGENVGAYTLSVSGVAVTGAASADHAGNYTITTHTGTFTIGARRITVTADDASKTYGDTDPPLTVHVTSGSLRAGDVIAGAPVRDSGESVVGSPYGIHQGTVGVTRSGADVTTNYALTFADGSFTITPRTVTIDARDLSKVYGTADPAPMYDLHNLVGTDTVAGAASCTTVGHTTDGVGTYASTYTCGAGSLSNTNYTFVTGHLGSLTITPATLYVDAKDLTQTYGDPEPSPVPVLRGFVNGDTAATFAPTGAAACTTLLTPTAASVTPYAHVYRCAPSSLHSDNYVFAQGNDGSLTIDQRVVQVTLDAGQHKTYGDSDPLPLTYTVTTGSVVVGDSFSGALHRASGQDVGTYAVDLGTLSLGPDYVLTLAPGGVFTIDKKPLTVTPTSTGKTYGGIDPPFAFGSTPTAYGDVVSATVTRAPGENVGTYSMSLSAVSVANGGTDKTGDYALTSATGTFTIGALDVYVTATAHQGKVYGDIEPALAYTFSPALPFGTDHFTGGLSRASGENVGGYAIQQGTLGLSSNFVLHYTGDTFTITARPVTVTADPQTKVFGMADPPLTYKVTSGSLAFGDLFTGGLVRDSGETVAGSPYPIRQGTLALSTNYSLTYVGASLKIIPATTATSLTVAPSSAQYSDQVTLTAHVGASVGGSALAGAVTFAIVGEPAIAPRPIDASGNAVVTVPLSGQILPLTATSALKGVTATFASTNTNYGGSSATGSVTETLEDATMDYTGDGLVVTSSTTTSTATVHLSAVVSEAQDGSLGTKLGATQVQFLVYKSTSSLSLLPDVTCTGNVTGVSGGVGSAACSLPLGADNYIVVLKLNGNGYYTAPDVTVAVTVALPGTGFVTGGGWITEPKLLTRSNFGFTAKTQKSGGVQGNSLYIYRKTLSSAQVINGVAVPAGDYDWIIKSNAMTQLTEACNTTTKVCTGNFTGKSNVTAVNRATGVAYDLGGNRQFQVDVTDNGEPGSSAATSPDTYAIKVWDSSGTYYQLTSQVALKGGNLQVHP